VDHSKSELTSTLHLSSREASTSLAGVLDEYIATLSEQDRLVIAEIQSSGGDKAMFLINRGESKGARFLITHEGATVGRSASSGIFLDDVTVSRAHAVVEKKGTAFVLRDSGSLNGTYVNNESVSEIVLKTGDAIQIGKFHLLFVCGQVKGK
jgi:FHA domain